MLAIRRRLSGGPPFGALLPEMLTCCLLLHQLQQRPALLFVIEVHMSVGFLLAVKVHSDPANWAFKEVNAFLGLLLSSKLVVKVSLVLIDALERKVGAQPALDFHGGYLLLEPHRELGVDCAELQRQVICALAFLRLHQLAELGRLDLLAHVLLSLGVLQICVELYHLLLIEFVSFDKQLVNQHFLVQLPSSIAAPKCLDRGSCHIEHLLPGRI